MKTRIAALASAALLGALAAASGCVDNRASIQVQAICVPNDTCEFAETCDAQYIGYPTLDKTTSASDDLWLLLQVENQLPENEDLGTGRLNTNDAHVDETVIAYEGAMAGEQSIGSNVLVPAQGTAVISVKLDLSPSPAPGAGATAEALARVRLRGYYDDGTRFETGDFPILIKICSGCVPAAGCLVGTCPPASDGQLPLTCVN
jgi:hypothetical protein